MKDSMTFKGKAAQVMFDALTRAKPPLAPAPGSESMFQCPQCKGPHFNAITDGTLMCASVSEFTNFRVKHGGCGWRGTPNSS